MYDSNLMAGIGNGIVCLILGFLIIKFQLADMLNLINPKKHDLKKACEIFGGHLMLAGVLSMFLTTLYYFNHLSEKQFLYSLLITMTLVIIAIYYKTYTRAKLPKNEN